MPKITEMYCFAMYDKDESDEGVPVFTSRDGELMPLMGADLTRIDSLRIVAQALADAFGKQLRIYKFTNREQIGEVNPTTKF